MWQFQIHKWNIIKVMIVYTEWLIWNVLKTLAALAADWLGVVMEMNAADWEGVQLE